ncbi:MAG: NAD-dependent epimerase/dehydratase family protein [Acidimicrobiales bacterium]
MALSVLVTGIGGVVGSRVASRLVDDPAVSVLAGVDRHQRVLDRVTVHRADLLADDLEPVFAGMDVVVHLATTFSPSSAGEEVARADVALLRRVLDASSAAGVTRLVLVSTAMVYGAWANNPTPLTEAAPLRPNPDFAYAVSRAEMERAAQAWAEEVGATLVVLRPTTTVAGDASSWVADSLREVGRLAVGDEDPAVQYLHLDDLVEAVVLATTTIAAGVYNVAPDESAPRSQIRRLSGAVPRARLTEDAARRVVSFRRRAGLARTSPGILPYTVHRWVVANDRLRGSGWEPSYSNAEAYVEAHSARPWAMLNSKRRQQIALGGLGAAAVTGAAAGAWVWRSMRRRR